MRLCMYAFDGNGPARIRRGAILPTAVLALLCGSRAVLGQPSVQGQWAGPYTLPIGGAEITHAALLPPRWNGAVQTHSNIGSVLFMVDPFPNCGALPTAGPTVTYLWAPGNPTSAQRRTVPNGPTTDLWCSGHAFTAAGD